MADFYDMNAAIRPQNYFASFVQGQQAGRQAQQYQQAQEDRNFFRQMAPQVIAGNPDATAQVAARSPEVAQSYQEAGDSQMRKVKGMVDYFDRARSSGNQAAVQGAWKQISPYLAQITGQQVPELYDEATEGPGLEQLKAQLAGLPASAVSGAVQSTYVDGEGNRVAIMRDGSTQILGRNDAGANQQTLTIDVNGVPTQVTFDRRTGRYSNAVMGGGQPSQSSGPPPAQPPPNVAGGQSQDDFASKSGEDYYQQLIAAGVPDEAATAAVGVYLTNLERRVPSFGGGQPSATQPRPVPQRDPIVFDPINGGIQQPGMPLVGRRKEDEAAAVEAAKIGAQLANAPAVAAAEADAARQKEEATSGVERAKKVPQYQNVERGLNRIQSALASLQGRIVDTGPVDQWAMMFTPEGQELTAAVGAIQNDMLALTRVPGIGSQSDLEAKIANLKYPDLRYHPQVNAANLQQLRRFIEDLGRSLGAAQGASRSDAQSASTIRLRYNPATGAIE